ncbi:hypothetical protein [Acinetobacter indicus]|uniref:hypothetical protein n=1 Tax=Acinetobacter indicus TaxID=756892 RepID=UPI002577B7E5|nr:hypothetical protein [Acinetobacter indicus]MDM1274042.1 hypothetical protein [Acinetobacter indicus]
MKTQKPLTNHDQFDQIVRGRIHAADFGQPQTQADFYKEKAVSQIECSIRSILNANNQPDLIVAIAQANAFIEAAYMFEIITMAEKFSFLEKIAEATRAQYLGEAV